ncbi:MAG: putative two-component sensor [Frankiales bacterium]|nr:putative two-component sensor [Frankiales bacterium]
MDPAPRKRHAEDLLRRGVRAWTARILIADAAVAVGLDVLTALPLIHRHESSPWVWLLDQGLVLPLVLRRRHPVPVFAFVAVLASIQWLGGQRLPADAALLVALYTVAAHERRSRAVVTAGVLEVGVVLASIRFAPTGDGVIGSLIFLTGLVAAAYLFGTSFQTRREYLASVEDRAVRLEAERDQQARLGAIAERTRIAREMHDIVAHNLSVIIALADGAHAAQETSPSTAADAMAQVAATGRQALGEMRTLLGVLRDDDDGMSGLGPQPDLQQLDDLLEQVRSTGLSVRKNVHGEPRPLSKTAELTVYRTVQEALTNTLKHAHAATAVTVLLDWRPETLHVVVTDDGTGNAEVTRSSAAGLGLTGMRERLGVHRGVLMAQPGTGGGWVVHAELPLSALDGGS